MSKIRPIYKCNPSLFETCRKTACQRECKFTTHREYAKKYKKKIRGRWKETVVTWRMRGWVY